ncbi:MAG: DUF3047 domain-containing protein [Desulfobacteraceae bacterium]|nr:DUF3047 domain-containing protein [Desulfobacteraceae bacterium]
MKKVLLLILTFSLLLISSLSLAETVMVGSFSRGDLEGWELKKYEGEVDYNIVTADGRKVLRAKSFAAASGRIRKMKIDLKKTPYLNWSWRVDNVMQGLDERTKKGDDYPARVYLVFSGGMQVWKTRAVNYVWSNNQPVGTEWPSAYTKNNMKIAVQSGKKKLGVWVEEKRNVVEDFRRLFKKDPPEKVDAVAIMTDTDNSGQSAIAYYGDIWFSSE